MPSAKPDVYDEAIAYFTQNLSAIKPPASDPVAWNLNNGLRLLAQAIQQDMADVKKRLAELDSNVTGIR